MEKQGSIFIIFWSLQPTLETWVEWQDPGFPVVLPRMLVNLCEKQKEGKYVSLSWLSFSLADSAFEMNTSFQN